MNSLNTAKVAYFSMEIGLSDDLPTYSGGLGVLAGDTIKAAADLAVPMVAVTLLYRKGYFKQAIDQQQGQTEAPVVWQPDKQLKKLETTVQVKIASRNVILSIWRLDVLGASGAIVPVLFLDSANPENEAQDQNLVDHLYGGDNHYRLCQEILLGFGGVKALRAIGFNQLQKFHMNEGHAAFLTLELLREQAENNCTKTIGMAEIAAVKQQAVFTTHTPVPAGHDRFTVPHITENLGDLFANWSTDPECLKFKEHLFENAYGEVFLNMTHLAMNFSSYVNGVALRHAEVSRQMFPSYQINAITNGVHNATWLAPAMAEVFDRHLSGWRGDNYRIRNAHKIPSVELWQAHQSAKNQLIAEASKCGQKLSPEVFTIGFARRFATYKRADLIFDQVDRLNEIAKKYGGLQLVFAGKAHPKDQGGKDLILNVIQAQTKLSEQVKLVFLPNYNMQLGRLITAGVDLWLNNPRRPLEASGTSGMKAALNGVPNLSILDGWWIEGCIEDITGWAIGTDSYEQLDLSMTNDLDRSNDANSIYDKLDTKILPLYCEERSKYIQVMQNAIALCGSYFHTQRMVNEYVVQGYYRG